jgi:serine/threonine-protein kinase
VSEATASSGGRLGRYHLVEPIGGGANGEVFRAKVYGVAGFERQFAVKKFFPHVALSSRYAQALSAAARGYGSLEHPRIARLAEFGVSGGHTFTATELVPGLDASRLLFETVGSGGSIPPGAALGLVSQAARAVGYAHGRGISHLGVAPTNLIVSPDGEVKLTDIGILGACMPEKPALDGRFVTRIHYLAPEQINGEPSSAATDVFALGLIAYELVTGERPFTGPTPEDVAQAILTGQPHEPQLPRPIMRVLQRCLARSPYERFPDARALADALDAALRVSPVPGSRGDIAQLVQAAMARIAALNEQALSGALLLNMPTGGAGWRDAQDGDQPTSPFERESAPTLGGAQNPFPASVTLQGAPPVNAPAPPPSGARFGPPPGAVPTHTLQGVQAPKLPRAPTGGMPPPIPANARRTGAMPIVRPDTEVTPPPSMPPAAARFATSEPTGQARALDRMATVERAQTGAPVAAPLRLETGEVAFDPVAAGRRMTTGEPVPPPPPPPGHLLAPPGAATHAVAKRLDSNRAVKIAATVAVLAIVVAGGLIAWHMLGDEDGSATSGKPVAGATGDAAAIAATAADARAIVVAADASTAVALADVDAEPVAAATADAEPVAAATADAEPVAAAGADATAATAADAAPQVVGTPDTNLILESSPPGARVFLDGTEQGVTPLSLPGTADRHSIAAVLPGHAPYIAEIAGTGKYTLTLEPVTPSTGPAGIKIKCRSKDRYYVWVDGKATGQLCPTERIHTALGDHVVEIYDFVTETRKQYRIDIKETRLSFRIRVD